MDRAVAITVAVEEGKGHHAFEALIFSLAWAISSYSFEGECSGGCCRMEEPLIGGPGPRDAPPHHHQVYPSIVAPATSIVIAFAAVCLSFPLRTTHMILSLQV